MYVHIMNSAMSSQSYSIYDAYMDRHVAFGPGCLRDMKRCGSQSSVSITGATASIEAKPATI